MACRFGGKQLTICRWHGAWHEASMITLRVSEYVEGMD